MVFEVIFVWYRTQFTLTCIWPIHPNHAHIDIFPYFENARKWSHTIRDNSMKRIIWTIINRYHYGNTYSSNNVSVRYNRFRNFQRVLYNFERWSNFLSVPDSEEFFNSCRAKSSKIRLNSRNSNSTT